MGADFDWKHNVTAHSAGPNLDAGRERGSKSEKKNFLDNSSRTVSSLPSPPSSVKAVFCLPLCFFSECTGMDPLSYKDTVAYHEIQPSCKGIPLLLTAKTSVQCNSWDPVKDQKVFYVAVGKSYSLSCWIHLNK